MAAAVAAGSLFCVTEGGLEERQLGIALCGAGFGVPGVAVGPAEGAGRGAVGGDVLVAHARATPSGPPAPASAPAGSASRSHPRRGDTRGTADSPSRWSCPPARGGARSLRTHCLAPGSAVVDLLHPVAPSASAVAGSVAGRTGSSPRNHALGRLRRRGYCAVTKPTMASTRPSASAWSSSA